MGQLHLSVWFEAALMLLLCVSLCFDRSELVIVAGCHFSHSVPEILSETQSLLYTLSQCCISAAWLDALVPGLAPIHTHRALKQYTGGMGKLCVIKRPPTEVWQRQTLSVSVPVSNQSHKPHKAVKNPLFFHSNTIYFIYSTYLPLRMQSFVYSLKDWELKWNPGQKRTLGCMNALNVKDLKRNYFQLLPHHILAQYL